jgi:hypothetical protein
MGPVIPCPIPTAGELEVFRPYPLNPHPKRRLSIGYMHINLETTAQFNFLDDEDSNNLFQSHLGAILYQRYSALNQHYSFAAGDLMT